MTVGVVVKLVNGIVKCIKYCMVTGMVVDEFGAFLCPWIFVQCG